MFHKENPPVGSRPGTLAIPPDSPPPEIHLVTYSAREASTRQVSDVGELAKLPRDGSTTWVDVRGLGDEGVLRRIAEIFGLHPIALEDAVNVPQRAKSELYENQQVVVARIPILEDDRVQVPQVCFVIGPDYLLTFQERYFRFFEPVRERIRAGIGPIRTSGPDYLAYALVDTLVDRYFPIAEDLAHELEDLEDRVVEDPDPEDLARIHKIRRQLTVIRRIGWPQREAIRAMMRDPSPFVRDDVRLFLRDTEDHMAQIVELVDSCREMAVGLMDIYLSNVSHKTNEVMKVLTLMASIFIPLTFIAGIYGMNFEYMPELQSPRAYPLVIAIMISVAVGMVLFFRRRGWLGGRRSRARDEVKR